MAGETSSSLPSQHRALVLYSPDEDPKVETRPLPELLQGTALFRVLKTPALSYTREIFQSKAPNYRKYPFPTPLVPGFAAIARVGAVASDATTLKPGQLIFFDPLTRARDLDGTSSSTPAMFLSAVHDGYSDASRHLMAHAGVRDGSCAEYMRAMLENCYILNESILTGARPEGLGYTFDDLCAIPVLIIPYGGLRSVDVRPGETVLVSPATGPFGGAACMVALALGAKVIAWGRNVDKLNSLKTKLSNINSKRYEGMIDIVPMTNDANADLQNIRNTAKRNGGGVDVFFDIAPPMAQGSHHLKTGMLAVKHSGRVSLMGGFRDDVLIPHQYVMHFDITIKGKWMYDRRDVVEFVKLVERGIVVLGERGGWEITGQFGLDDWQEAWNLAYDKNLVGQLVTVAP